MRRIGDYGQTDIFIRYTVQSFDIRAQMVFDVTGTLRNRTHTHIFRNDRLQTRCINAISFSKDENWLRRQPLLRPRIDRIFVPTVFCIRSPKYSSARDAAYRWLPIRRPTLSTYRWSVSWPELEFHIPPNRNVFRWTIYEREKLRIWKLKSTLRGGIINYKNTYTNWRTVSFSDTKVGFGQYTQLTTFKFRAKNCDSTLSGFFITVICQHDLVKGTVSRQYFSECNMYGFTFPRNCDERIIQPFWN